MLKINPQQPVTIMTQQALPPEAVPQPQTGFHEEEIDKELVLYHAETTRVVYLNPAATVVWRLCDGQRSLEEIISMVEQAYPEGQTIGTDIHATVSEFLDFGAISMS